jgi:ribosome-associated heat shock protein Hsp15
MDNSDKVRIDKWLWAARFYKTRGLAKAAIEGGKVQIDGQKSKPSRPVEVGIHMSIRQGLDTKIVEVIAISEHRRGAPGGAEAVQGNRRQHCPAGKARRRTQGL